MSKSEIIIISILLKLHQPIHGHLHANTVTVLKSTFKNYSFTFYLPLCYPSCYPHMSVNKYPRPWHVTGVQDRWGFRVPSSPHWFLDQTSQSLGIQTFTVLATTVSLTFTSFLSTWIVALLILPNLGNYIIFNSYFACLESVLWEVLQYIVYCQLPCHDHDLICSHGTIIY